MNKLPNSVLRPASMLVLLGWLAGCSVNPYTQTSQPPSSTPSVTPAPAVTALGDEIALRALSLVGKPYRYGGADLQGFDCSGMVYFIHQALGIEVPRTAADQQRAALNVSKPALQPGDLVFFRTTSGPRISHVGIYVGENRFVHAPQSGKLIEVRTLEDAYYSRRVAALGRLHPAS